LEGKAVFAAVDLIFAVYDKIISTDRRRITCPGSIVM
jgi:hypothetical protein